MEEVVAVCRSAEHGFALSRPAVHGRVTLWITGLRNSCKQLADLSPGLMDAILSRDGNGNLIRKAGVMATVVDGGVVRPGDAIRKVFPEGSFRPLEPV